MPVCTTPALMPTPTGGDAPDTYRTRGATMPPPYSPAELILIADLRGRPDAVDDVDEVRFRARGVGVPDGGGDVDARGPGVEGADNTEREDKGGDVNAEEIFPITDAEVTPDALGVGNDGRARTLPIVVLPLVTDRTLATDAIDRTERTECAEAFDIVRSRCSAVDTDDMLMDMDVDAGMGAGLAVLA